MIDAKIESTTKKMHGFFDQMTGLVYIPQEVGVQVSTVKSLEDKDFIIYLEEMPKDAEILNFGDIT